jgi:iron complex transport system ATP-binding protein
VVAALHDLNLAVRYADNLLVLDQGRLRAAGPPSEVLDRDLVRSVWQVEVDLYEGEQGTQIVPRRLGAER